jgi:cell division protein FtsZ
MRVAEEGLRRLEKQVDALIVVENQRLHTALGRQISLRNAFGVADRVLYHGIKGISDVINQPGMINVDFADVRTLLSNAGVVLMGIGAGRGETMVEDVVTTATRSPLLARDLRGAQQLLINITGSEDLALFDAHEIVERISEATGVEGVNVLFGVTYDEVAAGEVRLTVIAAGFDTKPATLRPADLGAGLQHTSGNYDIPAFLRHNPENER